MRCKIDSMLVTCLALLLMCVAVFGVEAKASDSMTLKMGLISADADPLTVACKKFADIVKEKTAGKVSINIIAGGALGGEIEMQDMLSEGVLDLASFGSAIPINYNSEFQLLNMPFLWDDTEQMLKFAQSDIQEEMNEKYREAAGIKVLAANWDQGLRNLISKRPIKTVADFKGLKVRVPQVPAWIDVWEMIGCNVVALPWPELYPALQQGVCDAAEPPLYWMNSASLQEQAKFVTMTGHIMYYNLLLMNDKKFSAMSADYQKIFKDAAIEAGVFETQLIQKKESELRAKLEADGVTFFDIDKDAIAKVTAPIYKQWESAYGQELLVKVLEFKKNNK